MADSDVPQWTAGAERRGRACSAKRPRRLCDACSCHGAPSLIMGTAGPLPGRADRQLTPLGRRRAWCLRRSVRARSVLAAMAAVQARWHGPSSGGTGQVTHCYKGRTAACYICQNECLSGDPRVSSTTLSEDYVETNELPIQSRAPSKQKCPKSRVQESGMQTLRGPLLCLRLARRADNLSVEHS